MIKILNEDGLELNYETFVFPGGEVSVKINSNHHRFFYNCHSITIDAKLKNSEEAFRLAMLVNAIRNKGEFKLNLRLMYLPYGRQDRVCGEGEAFSLCVFCDFINNLGFDSVTIADPHSEVSPALLIDCRIITQGHIFHQWKELGETILNRFTLVSPDAGSNKKVSKLASYFGHTNFIRADKIRNLETGEITETVVYADDLGGKNVMIVDDICDGGRTFIELAKSLKAKGANQIHLYVTHGIFSKGVQVLIDSGISMIWTTDSYYEGVELGDRKIFKL